MKNNSASFVMIASIIVSALCFVQCHSSTDNSDDTKKNLPALPDKGTGTLIVNGVPYTVFLCQAVSDTVYRSPLAIVPAVAITGIHGTDTVSIIITNMPTQSSGTQSFIKAISPYGGDVASVDLNTQTVTYTGAIEAVAFHSIAGDITITATNAGGSLTKTASNSCTFSFTTRELDTDKQVLTISGSGTY